MWDQKDVDLIAQCFEQLAPVSTEQRARLMVAIAQKCMITDWELFKAIEWHSHRVKKNYATEQRLLRKYTHQGCPGFQMEDVCNNPSECAEAGGCLLLK